MPPLFIITWHLQDILSPRLTSLLSGREEGSSYLPPIEFFIFVSNKSFVGYRFSSKSEMRSVEPWSTCYRIILTRFHLALNCKYHITSNCTHIVNQLEYSWKHDIYSSTLLKGVTKLIIVLNLSLKFPYRYGIPKLGRHVWYESL